MILQDIRTVDTASDWLIVNLGAVNKQKPPFDAEICSDICPRTLPVPRSERFSDSVTRTWKTVSIEKQIISKDKYPSIFSLQMEAIVIITLQIFFTSHAVLTIGTLRAVGFSYAKRERNHCEQPSAFPSSMRERHTTRDFSRGIN